MTTQAELNAFIQEMTDSDFMCGILDHLLAHNFSICESYDPDGQVYSRSAILMNGLAHLTHHKNTDFILCIGKLPIANEAETINWPSLYDTITELYGEGLDEWQMTGENDELVYTDFTILSWQSLVDAIASGKRPDLYHILNVFMKLFTRYTDYFLEYSDITMMCNFEGGVITDKTLENAFIHFVNFVQERVIPKLYIPVEN